MNGWVSNWSLLLTISWYVFWKISGAFVGFGDSVQKCSSPHSTHGERFLQPNRVWLKLWHWWHCETYDLVFCDWTWTLRSLSNLMKVFLDWMMFGNFTSTKGMGIPKPLFCICGEPPAFEIPSPENYWPTSFAGIWSGMPQDDSEVYCVGKTIRKVGLLVLLLFMIFVTLMFSLEMAASFIVRLMAGILDGENWYLKLPKRPSLYPLSPVCDGLSVEQRNVV